jgi:AraC family cel operon transcriptional repressor
MDLVSGDMVFFRPYDRHIYIRSGNNTAKHRDILFQSEFFNSVMDFLGKDFAGSYYSKNLPFKINVPLDKLEELENSINNYYLIKHDNAKEKLLSAKFMLIKLFGYFRNNTVLEEEKKNEYPTWLNDLLQQMNMSQLYKEGLPSIMSMFNYNKSYMCNIFKKYMGVTMTDYLNDLRLSYAASQIKLTNSSILYISHEAGFSSISYFNKLFKKKYRCTPKKFKHSPKTE